MGPAAEDCVGALEVGASERIQSSNARVLLYFLFSWHPSQSLDGRIFVAFHSSDWILAGSARYSAASSTIPLYTVYSNWLCVQYSATNSLFGFVRVTTMMEGLSRYDDTCGGFLCCVQLGTFFRLCWFVVVGGVFVVFLLFRGCRRTYRSYDVLVHNKCQCHTIPTNSHQITGSSSINY